jgi:molybdate transport system substrate-binding protein
VRPGAALVVVALLAAGVAGCGGSDPSALRVSAAASLKAAFTSYAADAFPDERIDQSFAGSNLLAAQIERGARPDVFASANTEYPDRLRREGLVGQPTVFARNRLVLAVPANSPIDSLSAVARPGTAVVVGDPEVPVGVYTREVLAHLPAADRAAILGNVRSEEPDTSSVTGKLAEGAADAGFVYVTDVRAAGTALRAIPLPRSLQPEVAYGIAVVSGAPHPALARRFVRGLAPGGPGFASLRHAGFLPPR